MRKTVVLVAAVLILGTTASALSYTNTPLNQRIADVPKTYTLEEIVEQGRGIKPQVGWLGGSNKAKAVVKSLTRAGRYVKYGGNILFAASMVNDALTWFYNQAQQASGSPALDSWWRPQNYPSPITFDGHDPYQFGCYNSFYVSNNGTTYNNTYWLAASFSNGYQSYAVYQRSIAIKSSGSQMTDQPSSIYGPTSDLSGAASKLNSVCVGQSDLASLAQIDPTVANAVRDIVSRYITANPTEARPKITLTPVPNINEENDDVLDPGIDSDGDGVTDGDELRRGPGVVTNPGNRPHTDDGAATDPSDSISKPLDTDGDSIPDWRDGDDDNDGVRDDEETPEQQKDATKKPDMYTDTDGDGVTDNLDADDDNDGASDIEEEKAATDSKDPLSKPQPSQEEQTCKASGGTWDASSKSCTQDPSKKDEETCKANGGTWDAESKTCKEDDPETPPGNDCGSFAVARLLKYPGSYIKDVVFPCEDPKDIIEPIINLLKTKFPFSLAASLNGWFQAPTGEGAASQMPTRLGIIPLDWGWLAPLWATIKTIVGIALWAWFIYWLIDRFTPRTQI